MGGCEIQEFVRTKNAIIAGSQFNACFLLLCLHVQLRIRVGCNQFLVDTQKTSQIVLFQRFQVAHVRTEQQQADFTLRILLFALFARVVLLRRVQQVVVLVEVKLLHQFLLFISTQLWFRTTQHKHLIYRLQRKIYACIRSYVLA